jgi:hypothetical protein
MGKRKKTNKKKKLLGQNKPKTTPPSMSSQGLVVDPEIAAYGGY